ncbi:MAG: YggS family pyridoxal phosphate-dependent enzyme [Oscillospiraceae bacterium]|nr:YggS family pyridoxal phosphate-dependent enzyme [Oscillospiraceae bacterium]
MMERQSIPDLDLQENICEIRERVGLAAAKSSRTPEEIAIMAVTKTVPVQRVNQAIGCGITLLGENRVQEYLEKYPLYKKDGCAIHFIGGLQTNKVRYIIDKVDMIQSVDSLHLAKEIEKRAAAVGKVMDVLLEINIGKEATKAGVLQENLLELAGAVDDLPHVRFSGLMAIPPSGGDTQQNTYYFSKMHHLFLDMQTKKLDNSSVRFLSMGMSGDFETAIACGANIVRLGTALFGKRK